MNIKYTYYFTFFLILIANVLNAQSNNVDSLKSVLAKTTDKDRKIQLLKDITNGYIRLQQSDSIEVYTNRLISIYKADNNIKEANRINLVHCQVLTFVNKPEEAYKCAKSLEDYYKKTDDYISRTKINAIFGSYYYNDVKLEKGLPYALENIRFYKEGKEHDDWALQGSFQMATTAYTLKNQYKEALKISQENLKYTEKDAPNLRVRALYSLAYLYATIKDYPKALSLYKESIHLCEKLGVGYDCTHLYGQLASTFYQLGKKDSTYFYTIKAIDIYKDKGDKKSAANLLANLAYYKGKDGYSKEAELYYKEALTMADKESELYDEIIQRRNTNQLSLYLKDIGNRPLDSNEKLRIRNSLKEIAPSLNKYLVKPELMLYVDNIEYFSMLANAYGKVDSFERAFFFSNKGVALRDSFYNVDKLKEFSNFESEIELEKEKARLLFEEETKRIQLQKEIELKALRFEFEKKQALAKSEEERRRLILEEELKRKEIELKFEKEQEAITLKFEKEKAIAEAEQEKREAIAKAELSRSKNIRNMSLLGGGLATILLGLAYWSYLQKQKDNKIIALEKQKSDDLLLNILPQEVAEELKANGETTAKHHDEVSVLFTDFVNFTATSEKVGVQELLNELNVYFTAFDRIMEKYGLEKIKTIGDAYLAVSGLPVNNPKHAQNAIKAAQEIITLINSRKKSNPDALDIRIGIHSGSVIAGIVGVKKFAYDIWGDTVNTAARMEQNSEKGKINVSETTYILAKNDFNFTHRGKINTKGKGEMDMYFVI